MNHRAADPEAQKLRASAVQSALSELIECEQGLGRLSPSSCVRRWKIANGYDLGDPDIKRSRCKGCPHGCRRAGEPQGGQACDQNEKLGPRNQMRTCRWRKCGKQFMPTGGRQIYCTPECCKEATKDRYRKPSAGDALPITGKATDAGTLTVSGTRVPVDVGDTAAEIAEKIRAVVPPLPPGEDIFTRMMNAPAKGAATVSHETPTAPVTVAARDPIVQQPVIPRPAALYVDAGSSEEVVLRVRAGFRTVRVEFIPPPAPGAPT